MSWLLSFALTSVPAWLHVDVPGRSPRCACARWWHGRSLVASVLQFCVALCVMALVVMALSPDAR